MRAPIHEQARMSVFPRGWPQQRGERDKARWKGSIDVRQKLQDPGLDRKEASKSIYIYISPENS